MVKIRLRRFGKRNTPVYRVVVADGRSPRDGRIIEEIGTYDPLLKNNNFTLKLDRVDYWLGVGAQASDTVASFIKKARMAGDEAPEGTLGEAEEEAVEDSVKAEAAPEPAVAEPEAEPEAAVVEEAAAKEATEPEAPAAPEASAPEEAPEPEAPAANKADSPKTDD